MPNPEVQTQGMLDEMKNQNILLDSRKIPRCKILYLSSIFELFCRRVKLKKLLIVELIALESEILKSQVNLGFGLQRC